MHIIQHNSTGENTIKIPINTKFPNITFNNNNNYNNISINIKSPIILKDESHEFLISISSFQIPISWSVISSYLGNNIFKYSINGIITSYTIPDGSYSANDLKILFNNNTTLIVTYSKTTGKYTFSHSTYDFSITDDTTCYDEIGFNNETYTSNTHILIGIKPIDLGGTRSIYIKSNLSTQNIDRNGIVSNIIDIIPIDVSNYDILRYKNLDGFRTKIKNQMIDTINIILEDDRGNNIDINNDWELVLEINKINIANSPVVDSTKIINIDDIDG